MMRSKNGIWVAIAILLLAAGESVADHPKIDTVTVKNGDKVTCEIKELTRGKLTAKTADMGTLDIKWSEVIAVYSQFYWRVETSNGDRFYGSLERKLGSDMLVIKGETTVAIEAIEAVEIVPIEQSFWDNNDGSFSIGFSYTKGSEVRQFTFDWNNVYRTERNIVNIRANAIITTTGKRADDTDTNTQANASITYYRLLNRKNWNGSLTASTQRNDELGLDRRFLAGFGIGVNLIKSNRQVFLISVGLAYNNELGADTTAATTSAEATFSTNYSFFKYNAPKTDITTSLDVFPSITEEDRIRANYDLKYMHELISDLTGNISVFIAYDSQPPTEGASTTDWGIVFSLGYTY